MAHWAANSADHGIRGAGIARRSAGVPWGRGIPLGWFLHLSWALACTSFAGLGDTPAEPLGDSGSDGEGSGAGVPVVRPSLEAQPPAPGVDIPGATLPSESSIQPGGIGERDAGEASPPPANPEPVVDAGGPPPPEPAVPPCLGWALRLDGSNFASFPRVFEDDFTLEAWLQTTASRNGNSGFYGLGVFDADVAGAGANDDFATGVLNDRYAFAVGNPDTTVQGITPVTTGQWVHVAVTRRRSTGQLAIFVNGVLDAVAVTPNRAALAAAQSIVLGGATPERHFVGLIDEVRIWNVVLGAEQLASNLRVPPSGSEDGLVGYYSFEDQGPSETADGSPLGLAATLTGGPVSYAPSSALCPPALAQSVRDFVPARPPE
jgi:Concanavalin A-like lectin/glucanases superfamily